MALGDNYATLPQLKSYLKITDAVDDDELEDALSSASKEIEEFCHRQFNKTTTATARVYFPDRAGLTVVHDFHTTTDLVVKVDDDDDGTYELTWTSADYVLQPLNGIMAGQTGWPYWEVHAADTSPVFPSTCRRPVVEVTAQWGWAAVPAPVKQACLIIAAETFKLKDAPFGVAGFGEFGAVRVRDNPMAAKKLTPYQIDPWLVVKT